MGLLEYVCAWGGCVDLHALQRRLVTCVLCGMPVNSNAGDLVQQRHGEVIRLLC